MPTSWLKQALDKPNLIRRPAVLLLIAGGNLILLRSGAWSSRAGRADWGFALAAVAIGLFGGVRPLAVVLGQSALLLAADAFGSFSDGPAVVVLMLTSCAVLELAVRRPWPQVAIGVAAVTTVYVIHVSDDLPSELPPVLYRAAVAVLGPALLGGYVRAMRRLARQAQQRAEEESRRRELEIRAARMSERTAIARELHDLVAHHVSSMVLRAGVARHVLPVEDKRVIDVLDDVHTTGTAALADLRRLVTVLRDPGQLPDDAAVPLVEPEGLPAALRTVVERGRQVGLEAEASIDPQTARLDAVRGLAVLRLVQEGLANAAKHAGPSARAQVTVRMNGVGEVDLRICDNGGVRNDGRTVSTAPGLGLGLVGMRERVELLGGTLRAGPADGGWELAVTLPSGGARP